MSITPLAGPAFTQAPLTSPKYSSSGEKTQKTTFVLQLEVRVIVLTGPRDLVVDVLEAAEIKSPHCREQTRKLWVPMTPGPRKAAVGRLVSLCR